MDYDSIVTSARNKLAWSGDESDHEMHGKLLDFLRKIKRTSLDGLADQVEGMRTIDKVYHAYRVTDDQDLKAQERGEPTKIIFPVTFAQLQTSLSALMAITDKNPFYELTSRNPMQYRNSKLMELELDYQLEQAGWTLIRYQWLKDMLKYGFGVLHTGFERRMNIVRQNRPIPILSNIFPWMTSESDEPVVGYEGVWFELNDPYTFKFDPSASVGEPRKWQYCFNSYRKSYNELKMAEEEEKYFNLDRIPERTTTILQKAGERERDFLTEEARSFITTSKSIIKGGDLIMVDVLYVKLVPAQYGLSDLEKMQIWKISMANEAVVIGAEPSRHEHGQFPINVIEYDPDWHELSNDGMGMTIDGMQRMFNWLINTHITNVRKLINDVLIVDPSMVDIEDLNQRKPIIKLKPTARGRIEQAVKQLMVQDITRGHLQDAGYVQSLIEMATGATANMQGQGDGKVRTATENSNTNRGAIARMGLLAKLCWDQGFRPNGQQMIQNTQQFIKTDRFLKVTGGMAAALGVDISKLQGGMLQCSPDDLQGMFSISLIDATTPSDKLMIATKLQEFLQMALQNPMVAIQLLGVDFGQLATQTMMGYGIRNTLDFIRPPTPDQVKFAMLAMQLSGQDGGPGKGNPNGVQVQVQPDEQVLDQAKRGNIIPQQEANNGNGRMV